MKQSHILLISLLLVACTQTPSNNAPIEENTASSSSSVQSAGTESSASSASSTETVETSRYFFRYFDEKGALSDYATFHGQLIEKDPSTGKENVLWEEKDMSTLLPSMKAKGNSLRVFTQISANTLLLQSLITESDNIAFDLFTFDLSTKKLHAMNINDASFYMGETKLSADKRWMIWPGVRDNDDRIDTLWIADVIADTKQPLVTVSSAKESVGSGCQELGCATGDYAFTDNHTIRYAVYNWAPCDSGITCDAAGGRPVLRYEDITIPE